MNYKLTDTTKVITYKDKVILANRETGQWMRVSKQSFAVLDIGIRKNLTKDELLKKLADDEDRQYISQLFRKLELMRLIKPEGMNYRPIGKEVYFKITHRCNLKCIHCCIDAASTEGSDPLNTQDVLNVLNTIILWNPKTIVISGGEPMVRKDIIEILNYLSNNYQGKVTLCTNGTLINEKDACMLAKSVQQIDISLDGVDEESCSIIRGHGVFDRVITNIRLIQKHGMKKIVVSMTLTDKSRHLERAFYDLNYQLGTKPLVRYFAPVGRGQDNVLKLMNKNHEKLFIPDSFLDLQNLEPIGACSCKAGGKLIFINHKGDIYPCPALTNAEFRIANISQIDDLYLLEEYRRNNSPAYVQLEELNPCNDDRCKDCKVSLFCWTCFDSFNRYRHEEKVFDQRCKYYKPVLFKRVWNE